MTSQNNRARQRVRQRPASSNRGHRYSGARHDNSSEVNCCVKYSIFSFNVFFFLIGFALVGVGSWAISEKDSTWARMKGSFHFFLDPAMILICIGLITFIIGFSGCVGSLRENTSLLSLYAALLGLILLIEVAIVAYGFVRFDDLKTTVETFTMDAIAGYRDDADLQGFIDVVQKSNKCCGYNNPNDWERNIYFAKQAKEVQVSSPEAGGVPFSCCKQDALEKDGLINYACGYGSRLDTSSNNSTAIFETGCSDVIRSYINDNIMMVGVLFVLVVVVQMVCICFAQNLKSDILAQKAKWLNS